MFPTFSGNSRRPRQVNLSGGQNKNPFAQSPGGTRPGQSGHAGPSGGRGAALALAQQDRIARRQERDRTKAAIVLQKIWRGNTARSDARKVIRGQWDKAESPTASSDTVMIDEDTKLTPQDMPPYASEQAALSQLALLLHFIDLRDTSDIARLQRFHSRWTKTLGAGGTLDPASRRACYRLVRACVDSLPQVDREVARDTITPIMRTFAVFCRKEIAISSDSYYLKLWRNLRSKKMFDWDLAMIPLQESSSAVLSAYRGFALSLLASPLRDVISKQDYSELATAVNCKILGKALREDLEEKQYRFAPFQMSNRKSRLSLLSNFICIYRHAHNFERPSRFASEQDFIYVVGTLLSSLVDEIDIEPGFTDPDDETTNTARARELKSVSTFEHDQIASLVDQESIRGLLGIINDMASGTSRQQSDSHSRVLAIYVLTLIRLFPKRANEIRMWLYMGLGSDQTQDQRPPVIRYFWQAASGSLAFNKIANDSRAAIELLRHRDDTHAASRRSSGHSDLEIDDQWRLMLLFFELYNFVLMVMDDDEFFRDGRDQQSTRTLTLRDVEKFTIFLKNLGFTMYYNASDIIGGPDTADTEKDLGKLFRYRQDDFIDENATEPEAREATVSIAGVHGITLDYVKGLVTGLLRQLYARDSRRPFLPKGHWLMTSRFDMTNFIDGVVEEEERRRHVEDDEDQDPDVNGVDDEEDQTSSLRPIRGTRDAGANRRMEMRQQAQRKASRKRYLQAVAPRQQILQSMPFFIPFTTRVQIFRRFVVMDQFKRRNGLIDGQQWQYMMPQPALARHHAKIRREHEFDDAYDQYYDLGPALKEPIQITFVDRFDTVEAGIDGGGVTKEFLTSVTNQAFAQEDGIKMFTENDQHLLFPNPSALDEQREVLREAGLKDDTSPFRAQMMDLLNRYEFLGRIIGKCLYEGILIDIGFAGFFLLKWALTGGAGSAPRESGYRASLNDLRDFDEGLYQGLVSVDGFRAAGPGLTIIVAKTQELHRQCRGLCSQLHHH